jgi:hypothetical protein
MGLLLDMCMARSAVAMNQDLCCTASCMLGITCNTVAPLRQLLPASSFVDSRFSYAAATISKQRSTHKICLVLAIRCTLKEHECTSGGLPLLNTVSSRRV